MNRRGLFAKEDMADVFKRERIPSTYNWEFSPKGQHMELGIAEMNLFIMLSALGLSHSINGERLIPVGTLYDPFIYRGADALNYACYQNARFLLVATPSGISLAGEGGAHQSIGTPLVGMAQDGLASFEPAFVDELAVIMAWAFDYLQREGEAEPDAEGWTRDSSGGSVYLRLSTKSVPSQSRRIDDALARDIVDGAYWMRRRGPNCEIVVAYTGAMAPEAMEAVGLMAEGRRDVGLLAITSADRLNAGWTAASRARESGEEDAKSHVERLLADVPARRGAHHRDRRSPGHAGLAGLRIWPPHALAGRGAFRPDGHAEGPLSPLWDRRPRHPEGRRRDCAGPAAALGVKLSRWRRSCPASWCRSRWRRGARAAGSDGSPQVRLTMRPRFTAGRAQICVGPAVHVLVVLHAEELAGVVGPALDQAAVPGPDRHVGDGVVVAGDDTRSRASRRSSTSSWRFTSMAKRSMAYSIFIGA